jgi:sulfate adenylyltransferase subunit 1
MLGLKVIAAVNKMDLVGWSQGRFDEIAGAMAGLAQVLGVELLATVPIAAKAGDNVVTRSPAAPWYAGPSLSELLETAPARAENAAGPLRLPIQRVARVTGPDGAPLRGYQGRIEHGTVSVGDALAIAGRADTVTVAALHVGADARRSAGPGLSVTVMLGEDVDLTRGDVLASPGVRHARSVTADLCWLDEDAWNPSVAYLLRQGALTTRAKIAGVHWVRDVTTLAEVAAADGLRLNDIARATVTTQAPLLADAYDELPSTGAFVLINPHTRQTAAAGMIRTAP